MTWAKSGLAWGFVVSVVVIVWTLFGMGGRDYFATPLAVRGYAPGHRLLRPSGPIGQSFGLAGTVLLLVPFAYMARKRLASARSMGTAKAWLEVHLFCGIVGPVLVTLHTTLKFNGIISAAYWSMVIVMLSGFVGRFLFVRIPRSIRGKELTRAELDASAGALREKISRSISSKYMLERIVRVEREAMPVDGVNRSLFDLLFGEFALSRKLRGLDRELENSGLPSATRAEVIQLTAERSMLLRKIAHLERTKKLFAMWHVFHLPLVYLLLVIAAAHITLALYMGYVPFRW